MFCFTGSKWTSNERERDRQRERERERDRDRERERPHHSGPYSLFIAL